MRGRLDARPRRRARRAAIIADDLVDAIPRAIADLNGEQIVRIAARGDGVTACGRHVALRRAGRRAGGRRDDRPGRITKCRHAVTFPNAAAASSSMSMTRPIAAIPCRGSRRRWRSTGSRPKSGRRTCRRPISRRRASLKALRTAQGVMLGFNAAKSHRIVDMRECFILRPELFALLQPLRSCWPASCAEGAAEVQMTLVDGGVDLLLKGCRAARA